MQMNDLFWASSFFWGCPAYLVVSGSPLFFSLLFLSAFPLLWKAKKGIAGDTLILLINDDSSDKRDVRGITNDAKYL